MSALCNPTALAGEYLRLRDGLLADHPELAEDERTLVDSLDGLSDAADAVAMLLRRSREDTATAKALTGIMEEMGARRERLQHRAERLKEEAHRLMEALGRRKVEFPDFTATVAAGRRSVIVTDPVAVPDALCRIRREPDKAVIREAIEEGREVPGAFLSNGGETLVVRFK